MPTAALAVLTLVLCFSYLQVSNSLLEERVVILEKQVSAGFGNVFVGKKARPEKVRASGEKLLDSLFKQQQSVNAPAMRALVSLNKEMIACNCDLELLSVSDSQIQLDLKNAEKLNAAKWAIPGYKITSKKDQGITSISLVEVNKP